MMILEWMGQKWDIELRVLHHSFFKSSILHSKRKKRNKAPSRRMAEGRFAYYRFIS